MAIPPDLDRLSEADREFILRVAAMQTSLLVRALTRSCGVNPEGEPEVLAQDLLGTLRHFAYPAA